MELFVDASVRSEPHVQPNTEQPFINPLSTRSSAGNFGKPVQTSNRAIRIPLQIVEISAGVTEVRRIRRVQRFAAYLQRQSFGHPDLAEHSHVEVDRTRPAQDVETCRSEAG